MVSKPNRVYNASVGKARALFVLILVMGFVSAGILHAQNKKTVVVLPFNGAISRTELMNLTRVFEESLSGVGSLQLIDQVWREKVLAYLNPELLTSNSVDDAVKVGKALSASTVVMGTVGGKENGNLVVSVRAITVATAKVVRTESKGVVSAADLPNAVCILASVLFGAPLTLPAGVRGLPPDEEKQQRLSALEAMRDDLNASIARINLQRAKAKTWGWVSLGIGIASAAFSGVSWYQGDLAYERYQSTSDTTEAEYYRQRVVLWDTVMLASAGTGVFCTGISIPIFMLRPDNRAENEELKRVQAEMTSLTSSQGVRE